MLFLLVMQSFVRSSTMWQRVLMASISVLAVAGSAALPEDWAIAAPPAASQPSLDALTWRNPQLLRSLSYQTEQVTWDYRVALSPDGRTLVGGDRTQLTVWDVETGEQRRTLSSFATLQTDAGLSALTFSPDGRWVAASLYEAASGSLRANVWNWETGELVNSIERHLPPLDVSSSPDQPPTYPTWSALAFSPDSQRLATIAGGNPQIIIWDLASGQAVQTLSGGFGWAIAFSHDGRYLARSNGVGMLNPSLNRVLVWDLNAPSRRPRSLAIEDDIHDLVFTPDNRGLYVAYRDEQDLSVFVRRWDLETQTASQNRFAFHWSTRLTFSPDGTTLISGSPHASMTVDDLQSGQRLSTIDEYFTWSPATAFSRDSQTFVVADPGNQAIQVWRPGQ